jgi:hypothetical protein
MTRKLNQTLFVGMSAFLTAGALGAVASADVSVGTPSVLTVWNATMDDLAPTNGTGKDAYLKKSDEQQSNEMAGAAFDAKGNGVFIEMRSSSVMLNGVLTQPPRVNGKDSRMQGACAPLQLAQSAAGAVEAKKLAGERFLTANDGNEYRNFNHPDVEKLTDATATQPAIFAVYYNEQVNTNDTRRRVMFVDQNCATIPATGGQTNGNVTPASAANPGVVVIAKNNDDCSMNQDGKAGVLVTRAPDTVQSVTWNGCNGNGSDDAWVTSITMKVSRDAAGKATGVAVTKHGDVSVLANEERSRGQCESIASDPNFFFCTGTEGNNQPQRDGTWAIGINAAPGAAPKIVWKKQIEGRKTLDLGAGKTAQTYSSRVMQAAVLDANLKNTDQFIVRTGDLQGNNTNNRKGGKYLTMMAGIAQATPAGLTWIQPMTNIQSKIPGTDGTHLVMAAGLFGANGAPGALLLQGTHTGAAGQSATARLMTVNGGKIEVEAAPLGTGAPYDRHLYSNYDGNNPGNQGRGFGDALVIANPFYGQNGNKDKVLLVTATNGKDASQIESMYKQSSYLSVTPVVSDAAAAGQSGTGTGAGTGNGAGNSSDTSVGGCSTGGSSGGLASLLLLGLMAIRRRRA